MVVLPDFTPQEVEPVKILMIGNGFDLAHKLPTSYMDFLNFIKLINEFSKNDIGEYEWNNLNLFPDLMSIYNKLHPFCRLCIENYVKGGKINPIITKFLDLINCNIWIELFNKDLKENNQNWIDFESEISNFVQEFEKAFNDITKNHKKPEDYMLFLKIFTNEFRTYVNKDELQEYKGKMLSDLNRLIDAFEIYLVECVEKIDIDEFLPDIKNQNFEYVLSFNYTNTYERLYAAHRRDAVSPEYDYIHGKINNKPNNIVLGISEYLKDEEKDTNTDYIEFKKYFQRIHKKTGCQYKKWLKAIKDSDLEAELYILGHSLDATDGDIIKELMMFSKIKTTIYYHSTEAYGKQIACLVKILGQDNLIEMVHEEPPKIVFEEQKALSPFILPRTPILV